MVPVFRSERIPRHSVYEDLKSSSVIGRVVLDISK